MTKYKPRKGINSSPPAPPQLLNHGFSLDKITLTEVREEQFTRIC